MHLLVLSAFRPDPAAAHIEFGHQLVSMHLLVLSAFRPHCPKESKRQLYVSMHLLVLSAFRRTTALTARTGISTSQCTFWCSVLSDWGRQLAPAITGSRVSMHLLVLSAFRHEATYTAAGVLGLNAPFGAQCFPTRVRTRIVARVVCVSMHLLVLSAFRLPNVPVRFIQVGLNAPFGAQCFPT